MTYETLLYDVEDGILTLTLHRPEKLNAFTDTMMREMVDALDRADADDAVRAIIVTGAGRAFCAGADLSAGAKTFDYAARDDRPDKQGTPLLPSGEPDLGHESVRDSGGRLVLRIYECLKPVIAAVNGAAVGIGVTMQLPMDIRLASSDARFGFVFSRRGIVPEACSSWFLPRVVGVSKALEWTFTGRILSAREALDGGLVSAVHAPEDLLPAARALAREIADNAAPVSVALTRQMIWRMAGADHPMEAHKIDSRAIWTRGRAEDAKEGVTAFLEKRPAEFRNRVSTNMPSFFPWWEPRRYE
ncbi:crotonase/enoyl-CoA hydratase family protein [Burkholderiaceae bacterium FT117]|uniref:crotonase/enoyl-CoA hydratase family protein n=1 Tax=Zeimonas sediminis TaxID=2944268 RepID=UPI002342FA73|nr:crotonase/enoyl-CoA hydratase family protein [Zeimonas sediminis]MCM5569570.1 crotonase/enoyl-CoA hydratase family protein [Zeimonas sediminis]